MITNYLLDSSFFVAKIRMHKRMSPHRDFDHMGETINLVENFKLKKVIFNCGPHNELEKESRKLKE